MHNAHCVEVIGGNVGKMPYLTENVNEQKGACFFYAVDKGKIQK